MTKRELLNYARGKYGENELHELEHAIDIATTAHEGQTRRSGEAYISHPLNVAKILVEWGLDIDSVVSGVLHDTLESLSRK